MLRMMHLILQHPPFPIALRLTLLYTAILGGILLLTSLSVLLGASYVLYRGIESDLESSANTVLRYFYAGGSAQDLSKGEMFLPPGVYMKLEDADGNLLLDDLQPHGRMKSLFDETHVLASLLPERKAFQLFRDKEDYYFRKHRVYETDAGVYQLAFTRRMSKEFEFLGILYELLIWIAAVAVLIALASGVYTGRRTLRPLKEIMQTAKSIEVRNLSVRIQTGERKDELSALASILNHMMDRLETGFEMQRRFVSDASHELRTPITVISGYVNMLARWGKDDPQVLAESIEAIRAEAENMHTLIEKLLFLARADQNRQLLQKSYFDLCALLEEISRETRLIAPSLTIVCGSLKHCEIYADESLVKQMVRIFIENSMKYTPDGGSITLGCQSTPHGTCLFIEDTGIGISPMDQGKIFDRFYRVDASRSKHTGGTGLGLAIAKWIADEHQAAISLASEEGRGTRITVIFPSVLQEGTSVVRT